MVKISKIRVQNYKGIKDISLEVEGGKSPGRFVTLVGLNEGGKTSIIEAIALSALQDPETADLLEATSTNIEMNDVVPKHLSAGFTGKFQVSVELDFANSDNYKDVVNDYLRRNGYLISGIVPDKIVITKWYSFDNSTYEKSGTTWDFLPSVKKVGGQKVVPLYETARTVWTGCINEIKKLLPRSVYFPTFLVRFPKRVYLEGGYGDIDKYYRNIINDALNGLSNPLNIQKHILDRINKHRKPGETFSSALRSSVEGRQIDATVQALAAELNFVIFGAWEDIFKRPVKNRQIVIEWHIDEDQGNHVYLEFYIIAGDHRFYISERSVGFRWFFSFLIFTQFQGFRADKRKILFLFDEPASHLHPKAQERLLTSFQKIADPNHVIVYSTHSHYLINPLWLEQAYIVSNSAIDSDGDETGIRNVDSQVKISASKYKKFVSSHPSRTTYYQPILDILDHGAGELDISDPVIILEGKFDFYPFKYFLEKIGRDGHFKVLPSVGAGGMSALIGILRGWGVRFFIVLDDDDAGRKEKTKYKDLLIAGDSQVATLDELSPALIGKEFEGIFQSDVREACVSAGFGGAKRITKEQFYTYFQGIKAGTVAESPVDDTIIIFKELIKEIDKRIHSQ